MKFQRFFSVVALTTVTLILANLLAGVASKEQFSENFPAVVCPPTLPGLTSQISIQKRSVKFRTVGSNSSKFIPMRMTRFKVIKNPILVDAQGISPVVWQSKAGNWTGGTICTAPVSNQWFVGGTSDVTTRGHLVLVNSGLSESIIDINVWSENGPELSKVFTVSDNSYITLSLDALAPGATQIVIHVAPRSGRVNSFLIDERGKGLRSLGGEMVNSSIESSKDIFIPAIPRAVKIASRIPQELRVLVPGDSDANFSVEVVSDDGKFTPVGLDEETIKSGVVNTISIDPDISSTFYGLVIHSDQPIVAAVYSRGAKDFTWSTAAPKLSPFALSVTGLNPTLIFTGDSIDVSITAKLSSGKTIKRRILGSDIGFWRVPDSVLSVSMTKVSKDTYGAALLSSQSGTGYFPLIPGSTLTRSEVPSANIRVLNP